MKEIPSHAAVHRRRSRVAIPHRIAKFTAYCKSAAPKEYPRRYEGAANALLYVAASAHLRAHLTSPSTEYAIICRAERCSRTDAVT